MAASYVIPEEPKPGPLARVAVRPFWPLFGTMIGPGPLGWAWFLLNAFVTRSPSRWREVLIAGVGVVAWVAVLLLQQQVHRVAPHIEPYVGIAVITLNIGVGYALWAQQERTFHLWEGMGRPVANGIFGVVAIFLLLRPMSVSGLRTVGLLPPAEVELERVAPTDDTDLPADPSGAP